MRTAYLAILAALLLAGCGGEEFQDLQEFVKNSGGLARQNTAAARG